MEHRKAGTLAGAALAALAALCLPAAAAAGEAGAAGADFLGVDPSPRATAMGEACTAGIQDSYASWWNPAGLALIERPEASATHMIGLEGVTLQYLSGAYPLSYGRTVGAHIIRQSVTAFEAYDASGGPIASPQVSQGAMGVSYAQTLWKDEIEKPVFSVGATFRRVSETLGSAAGSAMAFDAGAIYHLRPSQYWKSNRPTREIRLGAAVRNFGGSIKFDSQAFPLPQATSVGVALITYPSGSNMLTATADFTSAAGSKGGMSFGAEYFLYRLFALRAGVDPVSGMRFGLGYRLEMVDIDYTVCPFTDLGNVQKIGAVFRFGSIAAKQPLTGATARVGKAKVAAKKEKVEALKGYASDYLAKADKDLSAREYTLAADDLAKAFNLEPDLRKGEWGDKAGRVGNIVGKLQLKDAPVKEKTLQKDDEQAASAHEAVLAYVEGRDLKAMLLAHAAVGANPHGDPVFEELLNLLSGLTRLPIRREELLPKTALIKEKLKRAAKGFYVQQFDMAAKECEEVVLLDENNVMAWTRLGSAYYMSGNKSKARKAYEKALELNPNDNLTRQFMENQGWKPKPKEEPNP